MGNHRSPLDLVYTPLIYGEAMTYGQERSL